MTKCELGGLKIFNLWMDEQDHVVNLKRKAFTNLGLSGKQSELSHSSASINKRLGTSITMESKSRGNTKIDLN